MPGHFHTFSRRRPWYTLPRWRPTVAERDNVFWVSWGDDKKKEEPLVKPKPPVVVEAPDDKPEIPKVELATKLHVKGVELHIEENSKAHHTDKYECNQDRTRDGKQLKAELVIRRGQGFKMTITFDRPYDIDKNDIKLIFNLGKVAKPNSKMHGKCKVDEKGTTKHNPKKWRATLVEKKGNDLIVNVFVPVDVPMGEWNFCIQTTVDVKDGKDLIWQYEHNEEINIIFNPWCEKDQVYMEDEVWRNEAVLNNWGVQYLGSYDSMGVEDWTFGQFDDGVLDASFAIVRKCFDFLECREMGNPVTVARYISQIVNSCDDNGVLTGNWSGNYTGGTSPSAWASSVKILRQYLATGKPVKYGQCWVFSAVTTTVCRALGIPCRSVTNFESAHNTDRGNLNIDTRKYKDPTTGELEDLPKSDSVWNFHVWNEVWMRRPDLCKKGTYNGWQVIDATPQELSGKYFCCGPAPVKAVKEGEVHIGSDTCFVFAEVRADNCTWIYNEEADMMFLNSRRQGCTGKNISTHQPTGKRYEGERYGRPMHDPVYEGMERLDLTDTYKYPPKSQKGREVYKKASKKVKEMYGGDSDDDSDDKEGPPELLEITFERPGNTFVGQAFDVVAHVKNKSDSTIDVQNVKLRVFHSTYYDCYSGLVAAKDVKNIQLKKLEEKMFKIEVTSKMAQDSPDSSFIFKVMADATYKIGNDAEKCVCEKFSYQQICPSFTVVGPPVCNRGEQTVVEVSFTNPLKKKLTECELLLYGDFEWIDPAVDKMKIPDGLATGETWAKTLVMKPKRYPWGDDQRDVRVVFVSKELAGVTGFVKMKVKQF